MDPISIAFGLAQFAPAVLKWITGSDKAADAASKVVEIAQAVTGRPAAEAVAALQADPALVLQFRQAVMAQEADLDKAYLADRRSARDMLKATGSNMPAVLSIAVTMGYFGILCGMLSGLLKVSDSQALLLLLGSLSMAWGMVMAFWFGTTAGSGEKTRLLAAAPAK